MVVQRTELMWIQMFYAGDEDTIVNVTYLVSVTVICTGDTGDEDIVVQ